MSLDRLSKIQSLLKDKIQTKTMRPQFWKPVGLLSRVSPCRKTQSWLATSTSLTAKLKQLCPSLEVVVLSEKFEIPLQSESQRLGLAQNEEAWVRCVLLKCQQHNWVYARTIIPSFTSQNPWHELEHLGNQPLGEILFELPSIKRSPFEFSKDKLSFWPHLLTALKQPSLSNQPGFARRSTFSQKGAPLLLTEVFLPGLVEKH